MPDSKVYITFPMQKEDVEATRQGFEMLAKFPSIAWNYAHQIGLLLSKENACPKDGEQLAKLVAGMKADAMTAADLMAGLSSMMKDAVLKEQDIKSGRLQ
ncbi:hypothetical protein [Roseovarius mucosus]|uniref:hypothetical protein n=1 Tax=Roseovarius mucosus TaxID=215743 RepID=UPI003F72F70F